MFILINLISKRSSRMASRTRSKTSTESTNCIGEPPKTSKRKSETSKTFSAAAKRRWSSSKTSSGARSSRPGRSRKTSNSWKWLNSKCSKILKDRKKSFSKRGKTRSSKRAKSINLHQKLGSRKISYFCSSNRIQSLGVRSKINRKSSETASRKSWELIKN